MSISPPNNGEEEESVNGTVLLCKQSTEDPMKFIYTVMITSQDGRCNYVEGISGERVRYRKVSDVKTNALGSTGNADAKSEKENLTSNEEKKIGVEHTTIHTPKVDKGTVPSSIICNSATKKNGENSMEEGEVVSRHSMASQHGNDLHRNYDSQGKSIINGSNTRSESRTHTQIQTRIQMTMPRWLQKDWSSSLKLFRKYHLKYNIFLVTCMLESLIGTFLIQINSLASNVKVGWEFLI